MVKKRKFYTHHKVKLFVHGVSLRSTHSLIILLYSVYSKQPTIN